MSSHTGIGYRRTNSPLVLVTKSSRPYLPSIRERKAFGILSRPLSSIRAGALPLNTPPLVLIDHFSPQISTAIVEKAQEEVNRKTQPISKLRKIFALLFAYGFRSTQALG